MRNDVRKTATTHPLPKMADYPAEFFPDPDRLS